MAILMAAMPSSQFVGTTAFLPITALTAGLCSWVTLSWASRTSFCSSKACTGSTGSAALTRIFAWWSMMSSSSLPPTDRRKFHLCVDVWPSPPQHILSHHSYFVIHFSNERALSSVEVVLTHPAGLRLAVMADNAAAILLELAPAAAEPSAGRNCSHAALTGP